MLGMLAERSHTIAGSKGIGIDINLGTQKNLLNYKKGFDSDEDDKLSDFSYHSYASA